MGYVAKKVRDTFTDPVTKVKTTTIRMRPDGTPYWQVVYENRRKDRPADEPRERPIPKNKLSELGLEESDTFERAREACRHLNSKANLERRNERVRSRAIERDNLTNIVQSAYLPPLEVKEFQDKILCKRFAPDPDSAAYNRLISHWKFVQEMIKELEIEPKDYADESVQFYRYFQKQCVSLFRPTNPTTV